MNKQLSIMALFLLCTSFANAEQVSFAVKAGSWSFETEGVKSFGEASSGVGAYSFEMAYGFYPKFLAVAAFNVLMSEGISGTSAYGFDLGGRYYPFTDSTRVTSSSENVEVSVRESIRPYVGAFFRQRLFNLALATSYIGPGLSVGLDYSGWSGWFASAEVRYDQLFGPGEATATQMNILLGIGFEI